MNAFRKRGFQLLIRAYSVNFLHGFGFSVLAFTTVVSAMLAVVIEKTGRACKLNSRLEQGTLLTVQKVRLFGVCTVKK